MRRSVWSAQLKGIRRQRRGDRVIRYHRATGIRLPDDIPETHPAFIDAWAQAEARAGDPIFRAARSRPVTPGSVGEVIRMLRIGADWKSKSSSYLSIMQRETDAILDLYGDVMVAAIRRRHIEADLDKLGANPANARLKAWRMLMKAAKKHELIRDNPSDGIGKRQIKTDGHTAWSASDIQAFRDRHPIGTTPRACFELVNWSGTRTCDAVALSPAHVGADGILTFRQVKTGGAAHIPWTCPLPAWAQSWAAERAGVHDALRCLAGGFTFLEARGQVRSIKGLGNIISRGAEAAGLTDRTAHGLRKARLTAIAEAGGSAHAIMAWGGHKSLSEAQHYTSAAQVKRLVRGEEQVAAAIGKVK